MKRLIALALCASVLSAPAFAETATMTDAPGMTVTNWYKQNVYDRADQKIGQVADVLVSPDGKVSALVVSVGGFLGLGDKDVAVPFSAVKQTTKDGKVYLTLDTTKDALMSAPGFTYDSKTMMWTPATK